MGDAGVVSRLVKKPVISKERAFHKALEHHLLDNWSLLELEYLYIWNNASILTHPVRILSLGAKKYDTTTRN